MDYSNKHNIPEALVAAILNDSYDAGEAHISVTRLISPPQIVALGKRHAHEIQVDVSDRIWTLLGQAVHTILERAGNKFSEEVLITERRLFTKVQTDLGEWTVSGAFDRLRVAGGRLGDYKVTSVYSATQGDKPAWEQQLNLLAHLCRVNGVADPKELEIIAILRDWRKSQVGRNNYPKTQIMVIPVKLWPDREVVKFLKQRVMIHQRAAEGDIDECTPDETWEKPMTYALMKKQPGVPRHEQRAVKVYYSKKEAEAALHNRETHYIESRPGELTRCQSYCDVAEFCQQFKGALTF